MEYSQLHPLKRDRVLMRTRPPVEPRNVLVTGCSSGIGAATAHALRARGWTVVPTARKDADLDALRQEGFQPVRLDLADSASVSEAAEDTLRMFQGCVGALVNNAGYGQAGAVEDLSRDALRLQFEVNVFGMQELTNLLIPYLSKQGCGRIVNVSSVLGRIATPFVGAYCASKFALEALTDTMRVELRATGIAVILIEPGPIVSRFRKNAADRAAQFLPTRNSRFGERYEKEIERRRKREKRPDFFTRTPEDVAARIVRALETSRPRARYSVTFSAYGGAFARRFLPAGVIDHLLAGRVR